MVQKNVLLGEIEQTLIGRTEELNTMEEELENREKVVGQLEHKLKLRFTEL